MSFPDHSFSYYISSTTSQACGSSENAACSISCTNDEYHFHASTNSFLCPAFLSHKPGHCCPVTCSIRPISCHSSFTLPSGKSVYCCKGSCGVNTWNERCLSLLENRSKFLQLINNSKAKDKGNHAP